MNKSVRCKIKQNLNSLTLHLFNHQGHDYIKEVEVSESTCCITFSYAPKWNAESESM